MSAIHAACLKKFGDLMPYVTIDGPVYQRSKPRPGARIVFRAVVLVCAAIGIVGLILP
tara:strand:- start:241079 stop:241252 length:174 start_codon:yes stop_codon:yes gene_type:complete